MVIKITVPVAKVLAALLAAPDGDHYGLQLMRQATLPSGTLYPILARLRNVGWVDAHWEDVDAGQAGRPARRYYRLTSAGVAQARTALAELHAQTSVNGPSTPPATIRARSAW